MLKFSNDLENVEWKQKILEKSKIKQHMKGNGNIQFSRRNKLRDEKKRCLILTKNSKKRDNMFCNVKELNLVLLPCL